MCWHPHGMPPRDGQITPMFVIQLHFYRLQCSRIIKLQITTYTRVKLHNYKLVISNYCKIQITSQTLIHCKYAVGCREVWCHVWDRITTTSLPFVKWFTLCYWSVGPVCLQHWCIVAKRLDRLGCQLVRRYPLAQATLC